MEEIQDFLNNIKKAEKPIIVEGIRDKKALEKLGLNNIITLSKKPLFQTIEDIAPVKEIIILPDFDKAGKKLYGKLSKLCKQNKIKVDNSFREFLLKTKLSHIEGISTYIKNNKRNIPNVIPNWEWE